MSLSFWYLAVCRHPILGNGEMHEIRQMVEQQQPDILIRYAKKLFALPDQLPKIKQGLWQKLRTYEHDCVEAIAQILR